MCIWSKQILSQRKRVAESNEDDEESDTITEYYVKFKNQSYIHSDWVNESTINKWASNDVGLRQKLRHFARKSAEEVLILIETNESTYQLYAYSFFSRQISHISMAMVYNFFFQSHLIRSVTIAVYFYITNAKVDLKFYIAACPL